MSTFCLSRTEMIILFASPVFICHFRVFGAEGLCQSVILWNLLNVKNSFVLTLKEGMWEGLKGKEGRKLSFVPGMQLPSLPLLGNNPVRQECFFPNPHMGNGGTECG